MKAVDGVIADQVHQHAVRVLRRVGVTEVDPEFGADALAVETNVRRRRGLTGRLVRTGVGKQRTRQPIALGVRVDVLGCRIEAAVRNESVPRGGCSVGQRGSRFQIEPMMTNACTSMPFSGLWRLVDQVLKRIKVRAPLRAGGAAFGSSELMYHESPRRRT